MSEAEEIQELRDLYWKWRTARAESLSGLPRRVAKHRANFERFMQTIEQRKNPKIVQLPKPTNGYLSPYYRRKARAAAAALALSLVCLVGCSVTSPQKTSTPTAVERTAKPQPPLPQFNMRVQSMSAVLPPVQTNAAVIVRWTKPNSVWDGFSIYHNDQRMAVSGSQDNCTIRGLAPGLIVNVRAASYTWTHFMPANEWEAEDGPLTPMVVGEARTNLWTTPNQSIFAMRYTWPCVPNVTNVLLSSSNLTTWTAVSRFRGTNGTAAVVLTNAASFHRVLVQNAPPNTSLTVTQATAYVRLTWPGDGTPKILEREADASTGSYVTLLTNSSSGVVSVIQPFTGARYRVSKPF